MGNLYGKKVNERYQGFCNNLPYEIESKNYIINPTLVSVDQNYTTSCNKKLSRFKAKKNTDIVQLGKENSVINPFSVAINNKINYLIMVLKYQNNYHEGIKGKYLFIHRAKQMTTYLIFLLSKTVI